MKERSLVIFSLLTQFAIGAFWMLGVLYVWAAARVGADTAHALTTPGFLAVVLLMAGAVLTSLDHLGTPRNAWRALANLSSSWLSREILFILLFGMLAALFAVLHWLALGPAWLRLLLWLLGAAAGGLALYSMARIYLLRTVPAWNTWMTPLAFGLSALLLGGLGVGIALTLNPTARGDLLRLPLAVIALLALGLLAAQAVLTQLRGRDSQTLAFLALHMSLLVFALIVTSMLAYQCVVFDLAGRSAALAWLTGTAFLAALAEEALARYSFYRSFERVGL